MRTKGVPPNYRFPIFTQPLYNGIHTCVETMNPLGKKVLSSNSINLSINNTNQPPPRGMTKYAIRSWIMASNDRFKGKIEWINVLLFFLAINTSQTIIRRWMEWPYSPLQMFRYNIFYCINSKHHMHSSWSREVR